LDPDPYWILIGIQPKLLDPDPYKMNTDPRPWCKVSLIGIIASCTCFLFVLGTLHTSACTTTFMDAPKSLKPREIELNCPTVLVSEYRYFFLQITVFWWIADPMFIPDPESRIWFFQSRIQGWQDPWFGSATKNLQPKKLIPSSKKIRSGMCSGSWIWISYYSQSRLCWYKSRSANLILSGIDYTHLETLFGIKRICTVSFFEPPWWFYIICWDPDPPTYFI